MFGDTKYDIIGQGFAGWHAKAKNCSSSGGTLAKYLTEAREGALVYDASKSDYNAFCKLVISGPIVRPDLPPGTVKRFGDEDAEAARRMLPGLSGGFEVIAAKAIAEVKSGKKFSSLDEISTDLFESLLREIPGVKIGRVVNGAVEWEN